MKELSIEEKAKCYEEAIERAKSKINNDKNHVLYEDDIIEIFPELKEIKLPRITSEYCYVLDYNTGKVFKHCITKDEVDLTTEELLKKYGLNEDECSIMYASNNLELELLED